VIIVLKLVLKILEQELYSISEGLCIDLIGMALVRQPASHPSIHRVFRDTYSPTFSLSSLSL